MQLFVVIHIIQILKKIYKNMKTLSNHILESFTPVNEAFQSSILQIMLKTNEKLFKKALSSYDGGSLNIKWSEVTDSDIEKWDNVKKAAWHAKQSRGIITFWMNGETLLGISNGDWVAITERYYSKRTTKSAFTSISSISKQSTSAFIIRSIHGSAINSAKLKDERWASKQGAAEYRTNYEIASNNKKRYLAIIEKRKLDKSKEGVNVDALVQEAVNLSAATLVKLAGDADWKSIIQMNNLITELLKKYDEYVRYNEGAEKDAKADSTSRFYSEYALKYLGDVKKLVDNINNYNQEFIDEE